MTCVEYCPANNFADEDNNKCVSECEDGKYGDTFSGNYFYFIFLGKCI